MFSKEQIISNHYLPFVQQFHSQSLLSYSEICLLPKAEGRCSGQKNRWYFNSPENECKLFSYSGCWGNANRFTSKQNCEETCSRHFEPLRTRPSQIANNGLQRYSRILRTTRPNYWSMPEYPSSDGASANSKHEYNYHERRRVRPNNNLQSNRRDMGGILFCFVERC